MTNLPPILPGKGPVSYTHLTFKDTTITFALIGYAFVSALLPVWLILAPRDYLATFLKICVIVGLALGIVVLNLSLIHI